MSYILGRSGKTGRPTCMHILADGYTTICGYDFQGSSHQLTSVRLESILCMRCLSITQKK